MPPHSLPSTGRPITAPPRSRCALLATVIPALFAFAVIAIWLRNRDILRDLYDYSSVIVSAGKIEAGLRPYVDFRSTMQSATYALNRGVELLFGANYLGLTWGGLMLSLGGGAVLAWLWRRAFGWCTACVLAGAIAVSGFSLHVVIFYNPVGLLCLSIVAAALAHDPRLWRLRSPASTLACLALVLGGTNKINFHAFTCGIATLLILRAWFMGETSLRATLASTAMLVLCGAVAPLGLELLWTGATLDQWIENVLRLPAERVGFVTELLRRDIIFRPAYDIYHHFIFKKLTLVGLFLLAGTSVAAWRALDRDPHRRRATLWLLVATPTFACGAILLTVTNVESLALTSLAFVVGATTLWAALAQRMSEQARRFGAVALALASLLWTVVGGYAAWEGSRVMFGDAAPNREAFIRLNDPAPALAYLDGVRLDAGLYHSLRAATTELERLRNERGNLSTVMFGPTLEWMERAYPESIIRGMPVWYHVGTALRPDDGPWLKERLASKQVDRIILNPSWESWPIAFRDHLDRNFRHSELGPSLRLYEMRKADEPPSLRPRSIAGLRPLMFCRRTHSNIHINTTRPPADMDFCDSPWGEFLGRAGSSRWSWSNGARDMSGSFVAILQNRAGPPVHLAWRILSAPDNRELKSGVATLSNAHPDERASFDLQTQAESIRLEIDVPTNEETRILAGWRDIWIKQAGAPPPLPPPPAVDGNEEGHSEASSPSTFIRHACLKGAKIENDWFPAPFEAWRKCSTDCHPWKVRVEAKRRPDVSGSPTIVFLVWYKAGRIEILREKMVNPEDEETVELEGWMPEPDGWMGVFARAADITQPPNCHVKIESFTP